MYRIRNMRHSVDLALKNTALVLIKGARQTGKATRAKEITKKRGALYVTLDDHPTLEDALADPPSSKTWVIWL